MVVMFLAARAAAFNNVACRSLCVSFVMDLPLYVGNVERLTLNV